MIPYETRERHNTLATFIYFRRLTPLLGSTGSLESSGFNQYRNVDGFYVKNANPASILAEYNDWGVYTQQQIQAKVSGVVDFDPWIGKGIGPGTVVAQVLVGDTETPIPDSANPEVTVGSVIAPRDEISRLFISPISPALPPDYYPVRRR